ncbi:interferon regulatory factor 6-like [Branchiostoma floridae x Branchiostoma belcheri]
MENGSDDRKRLRRFFVSHLDANDVAGVRWLDRRAGLFRIDWPRGGRSGFNSERDGLIFKLWAQVTGKWKPGEPENPTIWSEWKTRVRNALFRLKDFQEQEALGKPNDPQEPFRVYKLVPPPKNVPVQEQGDGTRLSNEVTLDFFNDLDAIDALLSPETGNGACAPEQPIMLNIPVGNDGVQTNDQSMPSLEDFGIITPIQTAIPEPSQGACAMPQPLIANVPPESCAQPVDKSTASLQRELFGPFSNFQDCEVQVCVLYRGVQVMDQSYTVPTGFRVFHGSHVEQMASRHACQIFSKDGEKLFGPETMMPVPLPDCSPHTQSTKQRDSTLKLLNGTKRGILFQFDACGNIWAYRLCETAVYWLDPNSSQVPIKLERETPTKVFDIVQFLEILQGYATDTTGSKKKPLPYFKFCIGQSWNLEDPFDKNLVSVTVYQKTAAEHLETVRQNKDKTSLSLKFSEPTEDDHLVANLEQLIANLSLQQNSPPPPLNTGMQ